MSATAPPPLGPEHDRCPTCGAVLAADQRYCLNCGTRRAESRVPFPESLVGPAAPGAGATAGLPAPGSAAPGVAVAASGAESTPGLRRSWADRDLVLPVAGTALLAIAVGILIGRSGASDTITTKAPVVNVAPTAGAAVAAPTDTTASAAADGSAAADAKGANAKKTATTSDEAAPPANVSKSQLQDNAKASGKDYVNKSKKLPTEVSTGGAAPKKDDKAPGGGAGGGEVIQ